MVQKSTDGLPLKRGERLTDLPWMSVTVNSGAGLPANCFLIRAAFHFESSFTSRPPEGTLEKSAVGRNAVADTVQNVLMSDW